MAEASRRVQPGADGGASGRELDSWAKEWLQTSGVNTLSPEFELTGDGDYASFAVRQSGAGDDATLQWNDRSNNEQGFRVYRRLVARHGAP